MALALRPRLAGDALRCLRPRGLSWRAALLVWCGLLGVAPVLGQPRTLSQVASIAGPAQQIELDGKTLFIAADRTLRGVDIGNPSAPRLSATFTFPERITAFVASGGVVHALTDFFGLRVLDVSNPASPTLKGALELKGGVIDAVLLDAKTILTANMVAGVQVLDVSDPAKPALVTSHYTDGYVQDVSVSRPLVYVTDDPTGLHVLDLSKPGEPAEVSVTQLEVPPPPGGVGLVDFPSPRLALVDRPGAKPSRLAAVLDRTSGLLLLYDISNARAAALVSRIQVPPRSETLTARGTRIYVAAGAEGLHVVDASDPLKPVNAGLFKTPQPALDVAVVDSTVLVATGAGGVVILRDGP
jgi:hypothetical protein